MLFRRQVHFCTDTILTSEKWSNFAEEATRLFFQATCLPLLSALLLAQPLSDQILVNRAFCGKSMKLGKAVHHTKSSKLAIVPSQISPVGAVVAILKNGRCVTLSQKLRGIEPLLSTLYNIIGFLGRTFQKKYCRINHAIYPPFWSPFKQNGRHFRSNTSISETKKHIAFNFDSMSRFCGA